MKELAIGQIGVIDGVRVQCVANYSSMCAKRDCAFFDFSGPCKKCIAINAECRAGFRSDHTDVYFKKIEE